MTLIGARHPHRPAGTQHILVVADWSVDPHAIVAGLSRRTANQPVMWSLLMPAWLHGLDWAGDPYASGPCAQRALLTVRELAVSAGLRLDATIVGDPDPVTAVRDACAAIDCDAILLYTPNRRLSHGHPLDLAHRMRLATGLSVMRETLARGGSGHCHEEGELAA